MQLRSSSYAVTRRGDLACPGVGLDQGVEKAGVQGPASLLRSYAVTIIDLSHRLRSIIGGPPGTRTRDHRIKSHINVIVINN